MTARLLAYMMAVAIPGVAYAQVSDQRPVRRIEVDLGGGAVSGAGLGSAEANLRANDAARRSFRLFTADSRFAAAPTFHARAGFAFSRRVGVEGGVMLSRPEVRTSVSADVEDAPPVTIAERVDQYVIDASLFIMLDKWRVGGRTVPFVAGGAGYLRQLHEGLTLIKQGQVYHAGGGIKHWLVVRNRGLVRTAGLRLDARLYLMAGGISLGGHPRPHGAISGSVFVSF